MVDFKYADLYLKDSVDKQLSISFDGGEITNTELHQGRFELNESLCSEKQLRFGSCESSSIKFRISNIFTQLAGKWLTITEALDGNTDAIFSFGKYKVNSDKPTADRRYRDIVAYDAMYDILIAEVSEWYNEILPDSDSTVTLKEFRDSFFQNFGIEQQEVTLVNDSMVVSKTINPSQMSGKTVVNAICEINGCFGHIGRDGRFHYVFLKESSEVIYPSDTLYPMDNIYPMDGAKTETVSKSHYIKAEYEDFETEKITKLQIRQEENDIGCIYGTGENCYIVQDNFLVYGKSYDELNRVAENLYSAISDISYRPSHIEAKGNPCLELGDSIRVNTKYEIIYTYILQRTLKGIQSLRDTYVADGEQYQSEKVNSVHDSIIQLKGKTNKLTRTIEETRIEIEDIEAGLNSRITQTAESITAEVKRAQAQEVELASAISINANNINLKVSKGEVSSQLSVESGQVKITSNRFVLESTNCSISADGSIKASNVDLTGKITANSGKIGGFTIGEKSLYKGASYLGGVGVYFGDDGLSCNGTFGSTVINSDGSSVFKTGVDDGIKVYNSTTEYYSYVTPKGIKIKNSTYSLTTYSEKKIECGSDFTIESGGGVIIDTKSIGTRHVKIQAGSLIYADFETTTSYLYGGSTGLSVGRSGSKLGFFGSTGDSKKSITSISSTSSATTSSNATKINEILTALKAYNLIG